VTRCKDATTFFLLDIASNLCQETLLLRVQTMFATIAWKHSAGSCGREIATDFNDNVAAEAQGWAHATWALLIGWSKLSTPWCEGRALLPIMRKFGPVRPLHQHSHSTAEGQPQRQDQAKSRREV
jgi:hypothetical protein